MVANASAGHALRGPFLCGLLSLGSLGCVEGGNLAVSAGAPATALVQGRITDCGNPVSQAMVVLTVQQNEPAQARPVETRIGPVMTNRDGFYLVEVGPSFAVLGVASVGLEVTPDGEATQHFPAQTVELGLGTPEQHAARLDADLGAAHCDPA